MSWFEAILLGVIQGLTEFLPVSSSGHIELGKALFGINPENNLAFTIIVHGATVLSTLVVFFDEIKLIVKNSFSPVLNDSQKYILKLGVSMIPIFIAGIFFKDFVESFYQGDIKFVGYMLLITALLLILVTFIGKTQNKNIPFVDALLIGIAQVLAVLPGISRSGLTITTGLLLGNNREETAKFSFLMVIVPVIGANFLEIIDSNPFAMQEAFSFNYVLGFIAAFLSGLFACKWMIQLVKKGKLIYFGIYCLLVGIFAILLG